MTPMNVTLIANHPCHDNSKIVTIRMTKALSTTPPHPLSKTRTMQFKQQG